MGTARAYGAIPIAVLSVSFASIFFRWSESDPLVKAFYRLAIAAAILAPLVLIHHGRNLGIARRDMALMALTGAVLAVHFGTWVTSLNLTTVASSTLLVSVHPLLVGLLSHFVLRERIGRRRALGIALGLAGVATVVLGDHRGGTHGLLGDLLALAGGFMAGFYILAGRRLRQRLDLLPYAFTVYAFGALALLVFLGVGGALALGPGPLPSGGGHGLGTELLLFLALAVVSSIGGHTLYNWALKHLPASVVSLSLLGEPLGASLLAFLILAERPGDYVFIGGPIILLGIFLASYEGRAGTPGA